jgi:hypothetical protein
MDKQIFRFVHNEARRRAAEYCMVAPEGTIAEFKDATRSLEQNAAQWPILQAFAKQKQWPVNGVLEWITDEEYKDILTAAFYQENVRLAAGLDGGVVMLGRRTSKFKKKEFSDWLEFLHAAAVRFGIDLNYE